MISAKDFDTEGLLDDLSDADTRRFNELFREKVSEISTDRAIASLTKQFTERGKPLYDVRKAVIDSFAQDEDAPGSDRGYESILVNPLFECSDHTADVLLLKKTYRDVHFCFVCCEIDGEDQDSWASRVSSISTSFRENEEYLKRQLGCDGLDTGKVQYITLSREVDLSFVDIDVLQKMVSPDAYAVWEFDSDNQIIKHRSGKVRHTALRESIKGGLDWMKAEHDNLVFTTKEHPVIPIGEIFLSIVSNNETDSTVQHSWEFERPEFWREYENHMSIEDPEGDRRASLRNVANDLLDIAIETEMVFQDSEEINTDKEFRVRGRPQSGPSGIKDAIKEKYYKNKAGEESGRLAFERAEREFDPVDQDMNDFVDDG